ncbi:hypothetical protein [Rhizobium sp. P28RR-XV]|uniref:hypothetical protein n=1 Tax=Rhizobium sp. P28RR-XV TaxID=2726737 RepID=UPI001456ED77|nr:hypothetical protein [Rhizobium sp. P28RR-XV]NLR88645.1 hypothetical protein [Rhizobium sp. P28RR-XV]
MSDIASPEMRKLLRINPANVKMNYDGFIFRELFVRLPTGLIADDLKEPEIWEKVQKSSSVAVRKLDRLIMMSFDETWMAEAYVEQAGHMGVTLAKPRLTTLSQRTEKLFSDENYRVVWTGVGYRVERIRDGVAVSQAFANATLAERALTNMYPRRA